jgi:hypothetical protein
MRRLFLVTFLLVAGCDWRDYDHLKSETPVLSIGPSGGYSSADDFGRHLLALAGPAAGDKGGRFVVSAANHPEIGVVALDETGKVTVQATASPVFGQGGVTLAITSMAELPGTNKVILGAPEADGNGSVYLLTVGTTLAVESFLSPDDQERFGLGVAGGALAGGAAPEIVVASGSQLTVYLDGDPAQAVPAVPGPCPLDLSTGLLSRDRQNRAVLVAQLTGSGPPQIVVGTPTGEAGMGAVDVFTVDATTGVATCAFSFASAKPRFGHALATGDFDGDGTTDLLVGAPPAGAFWIRGPLTAGSPILPVALGATTTTGELGFSVAAVDLDGDGADEALVSDPDATVDGKPFAGEVRVAGGQMLDVQGTSLHRATAGANDALGNEVRALPFAGPTKTKVVPLVGGAKNVYGFFKVAAKDTDPRKR